MTDNDHTHRGEATRDADEWPGIDIEPPPGTTSGSREIWLFRDCRGELVCID